MTNLTLPRPAEESRTLAFLERWAAAWFARPRRTGAFVITSHFAVWTLVPALVNPNLPLDVIEGLAWGHAWQWGYPKHPPLSGWMLELASGLHPGHDWPLYALSAGAISVALWAVWRLARDLFAPVPALIALMLMEGVIYHTFTSPEFNANVALLPFWALALLCLWRGLNGAGLPVWALCGFFIGLAFLAKYFTFFLILAVALLFLTAPFRAHLRRPGPYLAAVAAAVVVAPHLWWALQHDFVTVGYGIARATAENRGWFSQHVAGPLRFALAQVLAMLPLVLLFSSLGRPRWRPPADRAQRYFFIVVALLPLFAVLLIAAATGWRLRSMWGTPLLLLAAPMMVLWCAPAFHGARLGRFLGVWIVIFALGPLVYGGLALLEPHLVGKGKRVHFPGRDLAARLDAEWQTLAYGPLETIVGNEWLAGNAAFYGRDRPQVMLNGSTAQSPWIDPDALRARGGLLVWPAFDANGTAVTLDGSGLADIAPAECLEEKRPISLRWRTGAPLPPLSIGWAVLHPQGTCS